LTNKYFLIKDILNRFIITIPDHIQVLVNQLRTCRLIEFNLKLIINTKWGKEGSGVQAQQKINSEKSVEAKIGKIITAEVVGEGDQVAAAAVAAVLEVGVVDKET
jgi:hypothetical protein